MTQRNSSRRRRSAQPTDSAKRPAAPYIHQNLPPYNLVSEEALDIVERNAEKLLLEVGVEFRDYPRALELFSKAGCDVSGDRVRFEKGLARELCKTAPSQFTQIARNKDRNVQIGGNATVFAPVYGSPFVRDLDNGRRYGTIEDMRNFVRLAYSQDIIHHSGGVLCEPVDVAIKHRHLEMLDAHIRNSDKPFMGSVTHPARAQDSVDIVRILLGENEIEQNPALISLINANSPLVWDATMLGALDVYAQNRQAVIVSPFILSGAMSPVSTIGTLTQILAEVMSGIALTQLIRPGTPVVFGAFVATINMRSGAPTFGFPESTRMVSGASALARRMNLPFRTGGGLCSSKLPDAQAAFESANSLWATSLARTNFVLHSAGWLEGGLVSSFEKFLMDCNLLTTFARLNEPLALDENEQAFDAFEEVGPGGHYLGSAHTQNNYRTAFMELPLHDSSSFEQWKEEGQSDMAMRANTKMKSILGNFEAPPLDEAISDELSAFMERRKIEIDQHGPN